MKVRYFRSPGEFRRWLAQHHADRDELIVGYHKKHTGKPSMTWSESVDEALCYGWIDGIRRKVDEDRYCIRFTPRRPKSIWSAVNLKKMKELIRDGRVQPAGRAIYEARDPSKEERYSFEQEAVALAPEYERKFKRSRRAWRFFSETLNLGYRKQSIHWVMSAKKTETRERRLGILIESSAEGRKVPQLRKPGE